MRAEYIAFLDSLPVHPSCLYFASEDGDVEEVKRILMNNPNLDVNWKNETNVKTALLAACERGYLFRSVSGQIDPAGYHGAPRGCCERVVVSIESP